MFTSRLEKDEESSSEKEESKMFGKRRPKAITSSNLMAVAIINEAELDT